MQYFKTLLRIFFCSSSVSFVRDFIQYNEVKPFNFQECQKSKFKKISFRKILTNNRYHAKVPLKRFYLNDNTIGFLQQTQKFEVHMSPYLTLGVKVLLGVEVTLRS